MITVYTDGACSGNPGPGGYGIVMISGKHRKELSAGFRKTTNNRMELMSVIVALEQIKLLRADVTVYSDSKYVVDAVEKGWLFEWERKQFKKKMNEDLWKKLLKLYRKHNVKFIWVRGHAENPENNHCDELAVAASHRYDLKIDEGYEKIKAKDEDMLF